MITTRFTIFITIVVYVLIGEEITAEKVLTNFTLSVTVTLLSALNATAGVRDDCLLQHHQANYDDFISARNCPSC
jgi:hypothetical protein